MATTSKDWPEMILAPVGRVKSPIKTPSLKANRDDLAPGLTRGDTLKKEQARIRDTISEITIFDPWTVLLKGLEAFSHILVLYWPHLISLEKRKITQVHPMGDKTIPKQGIFATCSPARPNPVLVSAVRLVSIKGNLLTVKGLEAVDNSPVIDIKPYTPHYMGVDGLRIAEWMEGL